jgi:hypothetical protein
MWRRHPEVEDSVPEDHLILWKAGDAGQLGPAQVFILTRTSNNIIIVFEGETTRRRYRMTPQNSVPGRV